MNFRVMVGNRTDDRCMSGESPLWKARIGVRKASIGVPNGLRFSLCGLFR
ncbi:hypothetical protein OAE63_00795 [bacterium]|nr:hypothetical protein [bacterium]